MVGILVTLARGARPVNIQSLSLDLLINTTGDCDGLRVDAEVMLDGAGVVKCLAMCPIDLSYSVDTAFDFLVETFRPL